MEGTKRTHSLLYSWAGVSEEIANNGLFWLRLSKIKARQCLPCKWRFSLLRLFLSDVLMAWRFYTPYDVNCTDLHILTALGMSHILTRIGNLWSSRKNCRKPILENYESEDHRLQYFRQKKVGEDFWIFDNTPPGYRNWKFQFVSMVRR